MLFLCCVAQGCELRVVKIAVLVTPMSDQKGCNVMIWTNLDIISVISLKEHIPYCQPWLIIETSRGKLPGKSAPKSVWISKIYDQEAFTDSSTLGQLQMFNRVKHRIFLTLAKPFANLDENCLNSS
ncbi:hypothetical protein T11_4643 [Trichinella zimbabwensis]|uniref:Uncharacterized protein n=1 Tax=Trichinella zimbabwensis TaxID=268475 RepID=A0A0V1H580_9BILA|nr:hypothetical protein T11_4643 [Trichinella zimbabwensis]